MKTFEDHWEQLRKKGKTKYILIHGLLLWGVPMSIIGSAYLHYRGGIPWKPMIYYSIPIFLIVGLFVGFILYKYLENSYNKHNK